NGRATTMSQLVSARVEGLDLRGASIQSLRLIGCRFDRCVLDGGTFEDLRVWNTTFSECSFKKAKLRQFSFGGELSGKFNLFSDCDFSGVDLRGAATGPASMVRCRFIDSNLKKVEFNGTRLVDAVFTGVLSEVGFYAHAVAFPNEPPNAM